MANEPISGPLPPSTGYSGYLMSFFILKLVFVFHQGLVFIHRETFSFTIEDNL